MKTIKTTFLLSFLILFAFSALAQNYEIKQKELCKLSPKNSPKDNDYPEHVTLGGDNVLGSLKIIISGDNLQVWRNTNTSPETWEYQWFGDYTGSTIKYPWRSSLLFISGSSYAGDALNTTYTVDGSAAIATDSYYSENIDYDNIDIVKIDNYNATVKMTKTGVIEVLQTVSYVKYSDFATYTWDVKNISGGSLSNLKFLTGGDTYSYGSDNGIGFWDGSTNTVGCKKDNGGTDVMVYIQAHTAPDAYESREYDLVRSSVNAGNLTNAVNTAVHDNAVALQWNYATLTDGETWTLGVYEKYSDKVISDLTVTAPLNETICPNETKDITFNVLNNSLSAVNNISLTEIIDLAGWTVNVTNPSGTFNLAAGADQDVTVSVTCSGTATAGDVAQATLTATDGTATGDDVAYIEVVNDCGPTITVQPIDQTVCAATEAVAFTLTATNAVSYQWQIDNSGWTNITNGGVYSNATTNTLNISDATGLVGTNYRCVVTNASGDTNSDVVTIILAASPVAPTSLAATFTTITEGGTTTLSYTGGSGTTFGWYTGSCGGTLVGTGNNLLVTPPTTPTTTYYGRWENACGESACLNIDITVNVVTYNVSGTLKYDNTATSALTSQEVKLMQGATEIATTTTDASGNYSFANVADGNYTVTPNITLIWKGVTAMDATLYRKHIANVSLLADLRWRSGDIISPSTPPADPIVTAADLTPIYQRIVTQITTFSAVNDFANSDGAVTVSGANQTVNMRAICYGDANASYSFAKNDLDPIIIENNDVLYFDNQDEFEIPVKLGTLINDLSSITLIIPYNSQAVDITEVTMAENNNNMNYTIKDGTIRIAYSNLNTTNFSEDDILFYIKGTVNNLTIPVSIINQVNGEFGNYNDDILNGIILDIPILSPTNVSGVNSDKNSILIYPNPAKKYLNISNINNSKLEIYDIYGKLIIQKETKNNLTKINTESLSNGTYFIKIYKNEKLITRKFTIIK